MSWHCVASFPPFGAKHKEESKMVQIDTTTLTSIIMSVGLVSLMFGVVGTLAFRQIQRKGKVRVFLMDPDSYAFEEKWVKPEGNEFTIGKKGADGTKTYILEADAALGSWPRTWIVHKRHGTNYKALSDRETVGEDPLLNRLAVSNPASYHMAIARNRQRDALNANAKDDKWGWVGPVVVGGVVCVVAVLCVVVWIAFKISSAAGSTPGG